MDIQNVLNKVDHTCLSPTATANDIKIICDEAIKFGAATVCIPTSYIDFVKKYTQNKIKICTVIGFPNGYNTTKIKCLETEDSLKNGANEIDMVINLGFLKNQEFKKLTDEISKIKEICGEKILKVIIETCHLNEHEKITMCEILNTTNADFIKTSTGFGKSSAQIEDILLFKKYLSENKKIKAAGGISTLEDAEKFIAVGADRIGASKIIKSLAEIQ